jgi:hypothetical protein
VNKKALVVLALLPLALAACENRREKAIEKIKGDEETLQKVSAVVNEVLQNASDCAVAKPLIPEAYKQIEEAGRGLSAPATQTTLNALKSQVDRVAQLCP